MKYFFISILILVKISFCSCQRNPIKNNKPNEEPKIELDSVKYLSGTTVLPWTKNQQIAKGYGLYLETVKINECDKSGRLPETEEVVSIQETDSTLVIQAKIIGNCCHDFLCDIEIVEEQVINLIYYGYGNTYCSCTCCYGITYEFSTMKIKEFEKLKTIMINGEEKTKSPLSK